MVDIYLQEMMHGRVLQNNKKPEIKSKFDKLMINYIDKLIEQMPEESFIPTNQMETSFRLKEKMRLKLIAEAKSLGFNDQVKQAIEIINTELIDLEMEQLDILREDFARARVILNEMDCSKEVVGEVKDILEISKESIDSIFTLATKKFQKLEYEKSLCLFLLLTKLESNPDFLYRAGIAAQVYGQIDLALTLYSEALKLDPEFIGPKLFSIECQLSLGFPELAQKMLSDFKQEFPELGDEQWTGVVEEIEQALKMAA